MRNLGRLLKLGFSLGERSMLISATLCILSQVSVRVVNIELVAERKSASKLDPVFGPCMLKTEKVDSVLYACPQWVGDRN